VWYRAHQPEQLEEVYNLEDALVVAMQLNAFFRHCRSVKMANLAQVVNVIAPIVTRPDGLLLQSIFYPFELYSQQAGDTVLDIAWEGDTFEGGDHSGLRLLDVSATRDSASNRLAVFVVNRSLDQTLEAELVLQEGAFAGAGVAFATGAGRRWGGLRRGGRIRCGEANELGVCIHRFFGANRS
jgi:alpha-N-arabinofuranosidase